MPMRSIISPVRSCSSAFSAKKSMIFWPSSTSFSRSSSVSSFMNGTTTVPIRSPILSVRLPPTQDRRALVLARRERAGHHVDAVHAAHAVAVVDLEAVRVADRDRRDRRARLQVLDLLQLDRLGRAARDDVVDQLVHAVLREPLLRQRLVGADVVAPGADDRHVRALDRVHAVVRAARELELELVRQRRAVDVVEEAVDHGAVRASPRRSTTARSARRRRRTSTCAPRGRRRRGRSRAR